VAELTQWARALGLPEPSAGSESAQRDELTARLRAALSGRRMLLLIDDAWQPDHAHCFCVGGRACATLVSTRLTDVATALAPSAADVYRLQLLSRDDGVELLQSLTPETVAQHPHAARALVDDLEGLPLALHVAGRLLATEARMGWGVEELLHELRDGAALLSAQAPHDMHAAGPDTSSTVQALLKRSTDGLDPDLRTRFALLGLFVPKPASFDLPAMAALWDTLDQIELAANDEVPGAGVAAHLDALDIHTRTFVDIVGDVDRLPLGAQRIDDQGRDPRDAEGVRRERLGARDTTHHPTGAWQVRHRVERHRGVDEALRVHRANVAARST
jgi:hypothetical protein